MRALAITGMETALMMLSIMSGSDIRETPPWARMSAGTRSNAITATAPASSAILACSAVTTSMITPPLSISAMPRLTRPVPVTGVGFSATVLLLLAASGLRTLPGYAGRRSAPTANRHAVACPTARGGLCASARGSCGRFGDHRVVDVEVAGLRVAAGEAQQAYQPAPAHRPRVPYQVVVDLSTERDAAAGPDHRGVALL